MKNIALFVGHHEAFRKLAYLDNWEVSRFVSKGYYVMQPTNPNYIHFFVWRGQPGIGRTQIIAPRVIVDFWL